MVDQRWVDLAFGYFGAYVLRDPGFNVAYWNAEFRRLDRNGDGQTVVNDEWPLRFFHFSGYSPRRPYLLSKWLGDRRASCCQSVPTSSRSARRTARSSRPTSSKNETGAAYAFDIASDGTPIDGVVRRLYRRELLAFEAGVATEEPPAAWGTNVGEFGAWLREPDDPRREARQLSRYLRALWSERPDIQVAFPDVIGRDASRLVAWARESGISSALRPTQSRRGASARRSR